MSRLDSRRTSAAFSEAEALLGFAEAGLTPGEALNDAKAGARTRIQ